MKRLTAVLLILPALLFSGCTVSGDIPPDAELSGIRFHRDHGSIWGVRLTLDIAPEGIKEVGVTKGGEWVERENLPIRPADWNKIADAVEKIRPALLAVRQKPQIWPFSLFGKVQRLDGTETRELTLIFKTQNGEEAVLYNWPESDAADQLETLLEDIAFAAVTE